MGLDLLDEGAAGMKYLLGYCFVFVFVGLMLIQE
jgi:hypothetical protein